MCDSSASYPGLRADRFPLTSLCHAVAWPLEPAVTQGNGSSPGCPSVHLRSRTVNAERLHAIVNALADELTESNNPELLRQLATTLQQSVSEPAQPSHQQAASSNRQQLEVALGKAASNQFSPAWRQALDELGVADLVGNGLLEQVRSILERNEITPAAAAVELAPIADRMDAFRTALTSLQAGFEFFSIGAEALDSGEFELGFLIPRPAVHDELGELGREFVRLKRILAPFVELATGSRPDIEVRSISSSGFQVFLASLPATALMWAMALERIIASYEKVMNIRLAHQQLKAAGASDETLQSVARDGAAKMDEDIGELVDELVARTSDPGRANELRKELTDALRALANRIDRGYSMEVRVGELGEADEDEELEPDEEAAHQRDDVAKVINLQQRLKFTNLTGTPILELPEGTIPEGASGQDPPPPDSRARPSGGGRAANKRSQAN